MCPCGPDDDQPEVIACSLTGGEMVTRQRWLDDLTRRALTVSRTREGATAVFPADPKLEAQLRALAAAEAACCPFLRLSVRQTRDGIELAVAGPPAARSMIDDLLGVVHEP